MIEKSELIGIIENAVKPLKCVAKLKEQGHKGSRLHFSQN